MTNTYKFITLMSLCFASADVIKEKLTPNPPTDIKEPWTKLIPELQGTQKPIFNTTDPEIRVETGIRRLTRIPPEIDAHAQDYKGNISLVVELDGKPCANARVDIFSLTAKIRRPKLAGDDTPIPPYPDVVAKRAETYYTGADGRLECDANAGSYMIVVLKDNWGGRSDAFTIGDPQDLTIKMVKF